MTDLVEPRFKAAKKKPKTPTKTQQRNMADGLFSKLIRSVGRCENCGGVEFLQCAHGFSRRYRATRWDEANAWALCRACHVYFTHRPIEWDEWMRERLGPELYEVIRQQALTGKGPDPAVLIPHLRQRLERLGAA